MLTLKWVPKSTFKTQFQESRQKWTFQPLFNQPWTRVKIALKLIKMGVYAYLSNGYLNAHSKLNSKKVEESACSLPWFDQFWTRAKIAPNIIKIGVHFLSLKCVSKYTIKFLLGESRQKCIFSTLVWPTLNEDQNTSKSHINRCPWLSLKWEPKSTFKTQFWESQQKCIFSMLV